MASSIFTTQTPVITDALDGAPGLTLGTTWYSTSAGLCIGLRWYFPGTLPSATVVAKLYSNVGAELATGTFVAPTAGTWNTCLFDVPFTISANTPYVAAIWTADRYVATVLFFTAAGVTNGNLTAPQSGTDPLGTGVLRNGVLVAGASPAFPSSPSGNQACYFVDPIVDFSITVGTGQAAETDTASALAGTKTVAVGLPSESDTGQAVTAAKTVTLTQPAETSIALPFSASKAAPVGRVDETDAGQPIGRAKTAAIGAVSETDLAQPVTGSKLLTLGIPGELDVAGTVVGAKVRLLGLGAEADGAAAIVRVKTIQIGLAATEDSAFALTIQGGHQPPAARGTVRLRSTTFRIRTP